MNVWLSEIKNEVVNVEKSKRRFMKMEKWNNVIQFHKKKKVLLRHLKGTKAKK